MVNVLVVGAGFAGELHGQAWSELGYRVYYYDIKKDKVDFGSYVRVIDPEIVDFCDTPKSRIEYLENYQELLEDRKIYLEKPVCRPQDFEKYLRLVDKFRIVPVHNYIFMDYGYKLPLEVAILRNGAHKGWYTDVDLVGGGILMDHGYHWLYVANSLGVEMSELKAWVDGIPDLTTAVWGDRFKLFATWRSPIRATVINGRLVEPRGTKTMVESLKRMFELDEDEEHELLIQSIEIMKFITEVYENVGFMVRKE